MDYLPTLQRQLYITFDWSLGTPDKIPYVMSSRDINILRHYARQVDLKRMDTITALDRCVGDVKGRNNHPTRTQR
jgi:hypothetical protein